MDERYERMRIRCARAALRRRDLQESMRSMRVEPQTHAKRARPGAEGDSVYKHQCVVR